MSSRFVKLPVFSKGMMNFIIVEEDGLESKFRTDTVVSVVSRDSGRVVNRNFRQIYLQFSLFYEGTGRMFYFIR